jgi:hypothetical protein
MLAHRHEPPPKAAGASPELNRVITRALAKDPADRYASAGDLGRAALDAAAGEPARALRGSVARGAAAPDAAETSVIPPTAVTARGDDAGDSPANGGTTAIATTRAPTAEEPPTAVAPTERAGRDAPPPPEPPPAAPPRVHRGRGRRFARRLTALVLAVPTVVVIAYVATQGGSAAGPLTAGEVDDVAHAFARAYGDENERALRRILTPGVRRVGTDAVQTGRVAVIGEYARQFAAADIESYALASLKTSGGRVGRAEGRYTVRRKGRPSIGGRVVLGVVRRDGKARIDLIATEPRG